MSNDLKDEASELFKQGKTEDAVAKFKACLEVDEYNINYNATINFNLGMAYSKLKQNEQALVHLNKAIQMNP